MDTRTSRRFNRAVLIVLDSLGVGALPDAQTQGDVGSNTLGHILEACPAIRIPNLTRLGLLETLPGGRDWGEALPGGRDSGRSDWGEAPPGGSDSEGHNPGGRSLRPHRAEGAYGRLALASAGTDTITGHWEIAGLISEVPFQTFERFPDDFVATFEAAIGTGTLGNVAASGTQIIEELGPEHERTGKPIIYTSADSVFQLAANTAVIPLDRLYTQCEIARELLVGPLLVGRVIARPYVEENGVRRRTSDRRDFALSPPAPTLLDHVREAGQEVVAIGKIEDIFSGRGITRAVHTRDNADGCARTLEALLEMQAGGPQGTAGTQRDPQTDDCTYGQRDPQTGGRTYGQRGLIFTNLVDFDSKYGHRRDVAGYARALEEFDAFLPQLLDALAPDSLLVLTADHGNDPCAKGFNHTREYVPVLYHGAGVSSRDLGTGETLADIGATISAVLGVAPPRNGSPAEI